MKVKRKGAYEYKRGWHQDQSAMVVQKAAEAMIVDGVDPLTFLKEHDDPFDFMLRAKVPRSSKLIADYGCGLREQIQNITRYAVVHDGPQLVKVMPPLPKNPEKWREISIQQGHCVQILNNSDEFNWKNINYDWYLEKVQKLVNFGDCE